MVIQCLHAPDFWPRMVLQVTIIHYLSLPLPLLFIITTIIAGHVHHCLDQHAGTVHAPT